VTETRPLQTQVIQETCGTCAPVGYATQTVQEVQPRVGLGGRLKNKFKKATGREKEELEIEGARYGPHGEKMKEKHKYEKHRESSKIRM